MKFECNINATAPTIFSEQLNTVIDLFQQWNDCERSVMLFAVLKKLPFPITKFLQSVIDTSLQQSQCKEQAKTLERNANCPKYINSLSETYKSFKYNDTQLTTDSIFFESDRSIDKLDKYYDKKEEILHDILKMMPILTIGNNDAKMAYLEFIPMTVSDATRRIVSSTLVQQIFCYVLIHPAFSTDDRGSVVKYLKDLETHISSNDPNFFLYRNGSSPTSEPTHPSTPSNWQAIAPPQSKSTETIPSPWGSSHHLGVYSDDNDYRNPAPSSSPQMRHLFGNSSDDHHTSFRMNGKTVDDLDDDDTDKSNTQIGYLSLPSLTKHIIVPDNMDIMDNSIIKTRRSLSLTTTGIHSAKQTTNEKQRSFSLSGISTSGGSETMDDFRAKLQPPQHHIGMGNIAPWLKTLRLHKYIFVFQHLTYEQMFNITDESLEQLNVTKGARHKLVNCIQKLTERYDVLRQLEKDLLRGQNIGKALEELSEIVVTPMKPMERFRPGDVATQFFKVLDLVSTKMTAKYFVPQYDEYITSLLFLIEKAIHTEAFFAQSNALKAHRYNLQQIKSQFPPKNPYSKSAGTATIHREKDRLRQHPSPRSIILKDYLTPKKAPLWTGNSLLSFPSLNQRTRKTESMLLVKQQQSFPNIESNSTKSTVSFSPICQDQPKLDWSHISNIYGATDDTFIFKKPLPPPPLFQKNQTLSGSVESVSSGYHSDGYPVGMSNIPRWLKSLRLHKYTDKFNNVTYERMLTFTEEYFTDLKITKGASHKLAICIDKLNSRIELLKQIQLNLTQNRMCVPEVIQELNSLVMTPMKPMLFSDTDVGFQFWKALNMVFNIIISGHCDEDTIQHFLRVIEASRNSEAFCDYSSHLHDMRIKLGPKRYR